MYMDLDKARNDIANLNIANGSQDRYKIMLPSNMRIDDFIKQSGQRIWLIWDRELDCSVNDTEEVVKKIVFYNDGIQTSYRTWLIQVAGILNKSNHFTYSDFMVMGEEMYNYQKDDNGDYDLRKIEGTELSVFLMFIGMWPNARDLGII